MSSQGFITIHKSNNCAVTSTLRAADDCWSSVYFHYYSTLDRACSIKSSSQSHTASEQFSYSIQMCSFRSGSLSELHVIVNEPIIFTKLKEILVTFIVIFARFQKLCLDSYLICVDLGKSSADMNQVHYRRRWKRSL